MHTLVTDIAKYGIAIPVILWVVVLVRLSKQDRLKFIVFSGVAAVVAAVIMKLGATVHQDPRPFVRDGVQPYFTHAADNGFPSDHTTFGTLLALLVMRYRRYLGVVSLIVALAVGTCRVIAGVHHGQDIVGGAVFAALGVGIALALERAFYRWAAQRHTPPSKS